MIIEMLTVGPIQENCFIVGDEDTGTGIIIDPGYETERILETVQRLNLRIDKIVNTHAHVDHVCAVQDVKEALGAQFYLHPDEQMHFEHLIEHAAMYDMPDARIPIVDSDLSDGDEITCGSLTFKAILTPGHSPGHCMLRVGDDIFCGDLIFAGSIGRTDLPGADHEKMIESLERAIMTLPGYIRLHPGHGETTMAAIEQECNPFLRGLTPRLSE